MSAPSNLEDPREIFRNMCRKETWDLLLGFCAIAADEDANTDIPTLQDAVQKIAAKIHVPDTADVYEQTARLSFTLFKEYEFKGDQENYDAPENSLLSHTLKRKKGLPITLCVLTLCVAELASIPLQGVNTPGHFLLRKPDAEPMFFIDPFHQGRIVRQDELRAQLETRHGKMDSASWENATETASVKDIFIRINNNLLITHRRHENLYGVMRALERLRYLIPDNAQLIRARAQLLGKLGYFGESIKELEVYVDQFPEAEDIEDAIKELALLKGMS